MGNHLHKTCVIHVTQEIHDELKEMCRRRGLDMKQIAESLIRKGIRDYREKFEVVPLRTKA